MFQRLYVAGYVFGRISGQNGATRLENKLALIVTFVYVMNSDARFGFSGGNNGFVNKVTVHSLTTKFREQRRVDVDNSVRKRPDQIGGHEPHKARQYDQVGTLLEQKLRNSVRLVKRWPVEEQDGNMKLIIKSTPCPVNDTRFGIIGQQEGYVYIGISGEVGCYLFRIGAGAGGK